jgi:hypothetical protein
VRAIHVGRYHVGECTHRFDLGLRLVQQRKHFGREIRRFIEYCVNQFRCAL